MGRRRRCLALGESQSAHLSTQRSGIKLTVKMGNSSTKIELPQSKVEESIIDLKTKRPIISVTIKCFHHEEEHHRNTEGKVVRTEKVKKETYRETEQFPFDGFQDVSPTLLLPHLTVDKPLVAIKLQLNIQPLDSHSKEMLAKFEQGLIERNRRRDKFIESDINYSLPGLDTNTKLVVFSDQMKTPPNDTFGTKTTKISYTIEKKFTVNPHFFPPQNTGYPPQQQFFNPTQQPLPYPQQNHHPYNPYPSQQTAPYNPYRGQQTVPHPPSYAGDQNPPPYTAEQSPPPYSEIQNPPAYNTMTEKKPPSSGKSGNGAKQQSTEDDWEFL